MTEPIYKLVAGKKGLRGASLKDLARHEASLEGIPRNWKRIPYRTKIGDGGCADDREIKIVIGVMYSVELES